MGWFRVICWKELRLQRGLEENRSGAGRPIVDGQGINERITMQLCARASARVGSQRIESLSRRGTSKQVTRGALGVEEASSHERCIFPLNKDFTEARTRGWRLRDLSSFSIRHCFRVSGFGTMC